MSNMAQINEDAAEIDPHVAQLMAERDSIVAKLPTRAPIFLPTEKIRLEQQITGLTRVHQLYSEDFEQLHRPRLEALREQFKGQKRAFIIGNGPSLNDTNLELLRGEVTFCVNSFFLKMEELNWTPTFYVVEDHLVAEDRADAINALSGPIKLFPVSLGYCIEPAEDVIFFNHRPRVSYPDGFDFSTDASKITYTGCTVTFTVMQLAHWLGFEELYLIGVDASYVLPKDTKDNSEYGVGVLDMKSDDPNHFHPDYFGKGFRWHDPQVDKMVEAYKEARRVTDESGRRIMNATVGGELEVFDRVDFNSLFGEDGTRYPRLAVVDMTPPGDGTATGELKANLLKGWPAECLLTVSSNGTTDVVVDGKAQANQHFKNEQDAVDAVLRFDPEVILYRPVAEKPKLHEAFERLLVQTSAPIVSWIMDDWPNRLEKAKPESAKAWDRLLRRLFATSYRNLSICSKMSGAFRERYGESFVAIANGVEPDDWRNARTLPHKPDTLVVRYAGSLAADMSLDSVIAVAKAVEALASDFDIRFEINTNPHWLRVAGYHFDAFERTTIAAEQRAPEGYREWLANADVLLIAYNFTDTTVEYVRYSRANKMPECLASGAAVLAVGSPEIATIEELGEVESVARVTKDPDASIRKILRAWAENPEKRVAAGKASQAYAFDNLTAAAQRRRFVNVMRQAVASVQGMPKLTRKALSAEDPADDMLDSDALEAGARFSVENAEGKHGGQGVAAALLHRVRLALDYYVSWRAAPAAALLGVSAYPVVTAEAFSPDLLLAPAGVAVLLAFLGLELSALRKR